MQIKFLRDFFPSPRIKTAICFSCSYTGGVFAIQEWFELIHKYSDCGENEASVFVYDGDNDDSLSPQSPLINVQPRADRKKMMGMERKRRSESL